jgi:hypothetical protein
VQVAGDPNESFLAFAASAVERRNRGNDPRNCIDTADIGDSRAAILRAIGAQRLLMRFNLSGGANASGKNRDRDSGAEVLHVVTSIVRRRSVGAKGNRQALLFLGPSAD